MINFEPTVDIFNGILCQYRIKEWRFNLYISLVALGAGIV